MAQADVQTSATAFVNWVTAALSGGPTDYEALLQQLLTQHRLRYVRRGHEAVPSDAEAAVSRVATVARERGTSTLLCLPNAEADWPTLIVATLALVHWWNRQTGDPRASRPILYVGTTVGIRDSLRNATIRGLSQELADALGQIDLARTASRVHHGHRPHLTRQPLVVTSYAPADPGKLLRDYSPATVLVDLGSDAAADWLAPLVTQARSRRTPVVGWSSNPLAAVSGRGDWASTVVLPGMHVDGQGEATFFTTHVRPLVLTGETADGVAERLGRSAATLARAALNPELRSAPGGAPMATDALRVHWSLIRALELVPCPTEDEAVRARDHWGLRSIAQLRSTAERFREACRGSYPRTREALTEAGALADEAFAMLQSRNPMWEALSSIAVDGGEGIVELAFATEARRALFLDSMLSRFGITEPDLASVNVRVRSLRDLNLQLAVDVPRAESNSTRTVIPGVIGDFDASRLRHILQRDDVEVAIYRNQSRPLQGRLGHWADLTSFHSSDVERLAWSAPAALSIPLPPRIASDSVIFWVDSGRSVAQPAMLGDWVDPDPSDELHRMFELAGAIGERNDDEEDELDEDDDSRGPEEGSLATGDVVDVSFTDGWHSIFDPSEPLMFVRRLGGHVRTESRPAAELAVGTEIVAIHGQRRQSLYALLVSRLHQNPAIALHLALVRRWHQELAQGYRVWSQGDDRGLDELLRRIQEAGSSITSELAVRLWLAGRILAPQDPEDLRRIADVLSLDFTRRNYRRIYAAASRLRGLHRGLANRINNWLEREAASQADEEDAPIDPEIGITFADFRSTLLYVRVTSVEFREGLYLRSRLGQLEQRGLND